LVQKLEMFDVYVCRWSVLTGSQCHRRRASTSRLVRAPARPGCPTALGRTCYRLVGVRTTSSLVTRPFTATRGRTSRLTRSPTSMAPCQPRTWDGHLLPLLPATSTSGRSPGSASARRPAAEVIQ